MTEMTKTTSDRVLGSRPAHTHRSPLSGVRWACNSPYCEDMDVPHPTEPNGAEPIVQGREPWRGR